MIRKLVALILSLAIPCSAVTTTFMESGTDATRDGTFFSSFAGAGTTGAIASATNQSHTGPRSFEISAGATIGGGSAVSLAAVAADAGTRIDYWYRIDGIENGNQILNVQNASAQNVFTIRINLNGALSINNGAGTSLGTAGVIPISTSTWTRLTISYTAASTTVNTIKVWVNGVLDANGTNVTLVRVGSDRISFSMSSNSIAGRNSWFDDIYVDNGATLDDPGDIRITAKRPNTNGTTNGFTGSGSPSGFTGTGNAQYVSEQPLNTGALVSKIGAGVATTEEYNIENQATGDVDIRGQNIVDSMGWLYSSSLVGETASIIIKGSSSNISLTSTNTMFLKASGSTIYPAGTGTDIGEVTDTSLTTVSLYEAGILIAYKRNDGNFFQLF